MAEFLPPVILEIQANATKAIAQMQTVNGELDKMEVKAVKAGGSIDVMTKASKYAGTALLSIAGVLGTVGAMSIKAALGVQESQAKLSTAVKNTGVSFQAFVPYMTKAQDQMAKLGFTATDTNQALASMTAATRNPQTAIDNLGVVADLAAFKNESLAAAADTVSRATMGQARGLADLGLAIGKTIPKGADLATITKMIEDRVHGAAQAAANADPWKVLTTEFGAMEEKLGTALLPAFTKVSNWIINTGLPALEKIGKWISDNKTLFEVVATALATLWVAPKVDAVVAAIGAIAAAWGGVAASAGAAATAEGAAAEIGAAGSVAGAASVASKAGKFGTEAALAVGGAAITSELAGKYLPSILGGPLSPSAKKYAAGLKSASVPVAQQPVGPAVTFMAPAGTNMSKYLTGSTASSLPSINSGKSPTIIPSTTKSKAAKKPSIAQQKAGIMGGGGALTLTITTDSGAVVKSITGSAGNTKVVVKK